MQRKKVTFLIILFLFLFLPSQINADLIPMECMSLNGEKPPAYCMYGNYKGPLYPRMFSINPLVGLSLNFTLVLLVTTIISYLQTKRVEKKIIFYVVGITLLGLLIDTIAIFLANSVHSYYYNQFIHATDFLINSFYNALFISSFTLLSIAYMSVYSLIHKKKITKLIIIGSLLLALINNPYWFLKYY